MSTHLLELTGKLINYVHKCRIGHREHNDGGYQPAYERWI